MLRLSILTLLLGTVELLGLPIGLVVESGQASLDANSSNHCSITADDGALLNWDSFSIGADESVRFIQPHTDAIAINRVLGTQPSEIFGRLSANGQILLINPNGVLFGKEARIDTASLIASTCELQKESLKLNKEHLWTGFEKGVKVEGEINAKNISLMGSTIEIMDGSRLIASSGFGGGTIDIYGKELFIQPLAHIEADALIEGNGGSVVFFGDERTYHYGFTSSQGGPLGGKGGFIEVSGKYLDFSGNVKVPGGTLLLDPTTVVIQSGGATLPVCGANTPVVNTIFDSMTLSMILDGCSVTIESTGAGPGTGDITVLDPITWTLGTNTLTLTAHRHIFVYNNISTTSAGASPINLTANTGNITIDAATAGIPVAVETIIGDITLSAPLGSISILGGVNPSDFAAVGQSVSPPVTSSGIINVAAGTDLLIQGGSASLAIAYIGRIGIVSGVGPATTITGDINICVGNNLSIYAGTGPGADAYIGLGNISLIVPCNIVAPFNFNINVGHTLDMMSGSTTGASYIGGGSSIDIFGDTRINVGEYLYMHNHLTNDPNPGFPWSTFIGYVFPGMSPCPMANSSHQNLYLNVGRNLTLDSRNPINRGGEVFIHFENAICDFMAFQGIQRIHVGGDINAIAGFRKAVINGLANPCPVNEVFVGGSIRCYNGDNPNAPAFVICNPSFAFGNLGLLTIRACGNIIQAGGIDFTAFLFSSFPIFFEADSTFAIGELWPPLSCIVNGSNVFAGTPLSVSSLNVSTVTPFNVGGDGLGGFAIDTAFYNCSPILFPSSVTGYYPILSPTTPPCPPSALASNSVTYFGSDDITLLSSDRYVDGTAADQGIGFNPNDIQFFTFPGDITVAGFRDIHIHEGMQTDIGGSILVIAQNDITIGPNVSGGPNFFGGPNSLSAADNLTLVVDNQAPIRPLIGGVWRGVGGLITVDAAAQLLSGVNGGSGYLRIYTARQSLNTILGSLNGFFFTPGTLFIDTLQEQWCTYYPEPFNGLPFTIFYKPCLQLVAQQAELIVAEMLENLHPYDEYPGWMARFWMVADPSYLLLSEPYILRRRHLHTINHPKTWTHLIVEDHSAPELKIEE